ncbi:chromophore lyase CpcT/CpeT [Leptothoe sp. LEGE 181152]|uniref:Chorismate mutase n=1 Tax=Adonisia turfae CCMR0081 TaxID=2292702 RepID=A0A6M0RSD1_9CYAN|nr:chromophore lyase CpcT/CpeT [Adonisia turfae]MDV3350093.1 chromophore lyase CpcT/CpeT [Leptothoe sp. LEGE 181152]NEZ59144.1 chorismate mutase [Adonisia turfae CCMR0081]
MPRLWSLTPVLLGVWLSSSHTSHAPTPAISPQHVDAVVEHLTRPMDTTEQAERNSRFVGVQMTTCPIQVTGSAEQYGIYLYQEQALTAHIESPYRQRFLYITLSKDATRVESHTFKPPIPETWTGLCQQATPSIDTHALGELVCVVSLRPSTLGYVGSTPTEGCPVNLRGAVRLTNTIVLHQDGMDTWDRGFDANGEQVWGAEVEPYQYRWLDE